MNWPDVYREHTIAPGLDHEQTMRYLTLRRLRLIGMLWTEGGGQYVLSPVGVDRRDCAEPINIAKLLKLISSLELEQLRKPVQSADRVTEASACAA